MTSKRVRLPQCAQRQRERSSGTQRCRPRADPTDPIDPARAARRLSGRSPSFGGMDPARGTQASFDDLGTPLRDVTFVVVDLETTGGAPADAGITEIGAVKVRGGEVSASSRPSSTPASRSRRSSRSSPASPTPSSPARPATAAVLPAFLEFAGGAVLVAHNAPYDVGFLKAACALHAYRWPDAPVVDTARLARVALHRDEVRNCKLGTLAAHFRTTVTPNHRAFDDARATVDVLHGLIERVGDLGVAPSRSCSLHLARQRGAAHEAPPRRGPAGRPRRLRLPRRPGPPALRRHVAQHPHARPHATSPRPSSAGGWPRWSASPSGSCRSSAPPRSRPRCASCGSSPSTSRATTGAPATPSPVWVKLTVEPFPRLALVRVVADDTADGARYLGPFGSRRAAEAAAEALLLAHPAPHLHDPHRPSARGRSPGLRARRAGPVPGPVHGRRATATAYAAVVGGLRATPCPATSRRGRPPWACGWPGSPTRSATRRRRSGATGSATSPAPACAPTAWPCWRPSPSSSPPSRPPTAAGRSTWSATAGWRAPRTRRPGSTRDRRRGPVASAEHVEPAPRAGAGGPHRGGPRAARLARRRPACAWSASTRGLGAAARAAGATSSSGSARCGARPTRRGARATTTGPSPMPSRPVGPVDAVPVTRMATA